MNGETEKKSEPGSQLVEKVMPPEPVVAEPTGTPSGDEIAEFEALLTELAQQLNYIGYVQTGMIGPGAAQTELAQITADLQSDGLPISYAYLSRHEDIWNAIRTFFQDQASAALRD